MNALGFSHRQNIIYREDTLESRLSLLERWKTEGTIDTEEYNELLKDCTENQVLMDNERKYGKNQTKENTQMETKHTKGIVKIGNIDSTVVTDTKPEWLNRDTGHGETEYYGGYLICESVQNPYDTQLISEAFNVTNETGKTPRQLSNENKEFLDVLLEVRKYMTAHIPEKVFDLIDSVIKNQ